MNIHYAAKKIVLPQALQLVYGNGYILDVCEKGFEHLRFNHAFFV